MFVLNFELPGEDAIFFSMASSSELQSSQFQLDILPAPQRRLWRELTLKALCYFGDGNLSTVPTEIQARLVQSVNAVDLSSLPI